MNHQTDLLNGLTEEESAAFMALALRVDLPAGKLLFQLGEPADRMFLVINGRVSLTLPMLIGGRERDVLVEEKMAGQTLGWSGLIPPYRFTLRAVAAVDSQLLAFPRNAAMQHFDRNPGVAYKVTRNVATVIGHRLDVFQTMWLREMQRVVQLQYS
jgi:CRP/FNR family transcriptional regulator, cyclic AMP receptor protein